MQKIYDNMQYNFRNFSISNFMTKLDVYNMADVVRVELGKSARKPLDPFSVVYKYPDTLGIKFHRFDSEKIGGFIVKNDPQYDKSFIILNATKPPESKKFNCCHELVHFFKHPCDSYTCASYLNNSDPFEYQANECAAELLIPYRDAVPFIAAQWEEALSVVKTDPQFGDLPFGFIPIRISKRYGVSEKIAEYRITSLDYEVFQYFNGTDIDRLQIVSRRKQDQYRIKFSPISERCKSGSVALNFLPDYIIDDYTDKHQLKRRSAIEWDAEITEAIYVTKEEMELLDFLKLGE